MLAALEIMPRVGAMLLTETDYCVPLLRLLADFPDGKGRGRDVIVQFGTLYYDLIPKHDLMPIPSGSAVKRWEIKLRVARQMLVDRGLVDRPSLNVWRITLAGRTWLDGNPQATHLPDLSNNEPTPQPSRTVDQNRSPDPIPQTEALETPVADSVTLTISDRQIVLSRGQVLASARRALANGVPIEAYNYLSWAVEIDGQLVGAKWLFGLVTMVPRTTFDSAQACSAFERLGLVVRYIDSPPVPAAKRPTSATRPREKMRSTVSNAPTWGNPKSPHTILDAQIKAIHSFLAGRASRPSDEKLCDWVHFCYTFELYREADALFQLVDPALVDRWQYERSKRLATICRMKITGRA